MPVLRPVAVALAAVLSIATVSMATVSTATANFSPRVRAACTGDSKRLCPKHKLGTPEMRYCMETHVNAISRPCIKALEDDGHIPRGSVRR